MKLKIAHLYPDLLNLYGDIGNITTVTKRCEWRGIGIETDSIYGSEKIHFTDYDLVFLGGGSDREQLLVRDKLMSMKDVWSVFHSMTKLAKKEKCFQQKQLIKILNHI